MDDSKITAENAPQYQKDLKQFVDSMTEEDWHGDEPEDKSPESVETEKQWLKDFVDECNPEEVTWLKRFVDSMEPQYKKDIHDFVDSMEQ